MRKTVVLVALLTTPVCGAWALGGDVQATPASQAIPDLVYEVGQPGTPVFVRLEALQRPDGSLDADRLPYTIRRELQSEPGDPDGPTEFLGPIPEVFADYRPSLQAAIESSDWVFVADVKATAIGIFGPAQHVGTLLEVSPTEVIKGPSWHWSRYVFVPTADFALAGHRFVTRSPFYAPLPEVGDRVLLLIDLHVWNREGKVLDTGSFTGLITLPPEGPVGLPDRYRESDPELVGMSTEAFLEWAQVRREGGAK